ncbi:uncharacterized protein LOC122192355 isoform X3 [Lagopus leucura]|uniref:uncharacterized protein LOC122192355 isoform X3 n=1 Tax=Lagopus leucura TaxID=30410 RepID=UPI001C663809|nr:uncharacterized protein LOC122192355 isoform X3 [Lagopus leucura]
MESGTWTGMEEWGRAEPRLAIGAARMEKKLGPKPGRSSTPHDSQWPPAAPQGWESSPSTAASPGAAALVAELTMLSPHPRRSVLQHGGGSMARVWGAAAPARLALLLPTGGHVFPGGWCCSVASTSRWVGRDGAKIERRRGREVWALIPLCPGAACRGAVGVGGRAALQEPGEGVRKRYSAGRAGPWLCAG